MDPLFRVRALSRTAFPQKLVWQAMHQDYSEEFVAEESFPTEHDAGLLVVRHLLKGDKGHYGPLEHPSITFNVGFFPHDVMQQARTHRVAVSFDVQSGRYTGQRLVDLANGELDVDQVFYRRPVGVYRDRQGKQYEYTEQQREIDRILFLDIAGRYKLDIENGFSEEHARRHVPYALRQHFVVTFNLRSLLHFLDLRAKKDAQLEITQLCDLLWPHLEEWTPAIAGWYGETRLHRARLAP